MHHTLYLSDNVCIRLTFCECIVSKICLVKTKVFCGSEYLTIVFTHFKKTIHFGLVPKQQKATRNPIRTNTNQVELTQDCFRQKIANIPINHVNITKRPEVILFQQVPKNDTIGWLKITEFISILNTNFEP